MPRPRLLQCHERGPQGGRGEWAPSEPRVLFLERSHLMVTAKPRGHLCLSYSLLPECRRTAAEDQACRTLTRKAHPKRLLAQAANKRWHKDTEGAEQRDRRRVGGRGVAPLTEAPTFPSEPPPLPSTWGRSGCCGVPHVPRAEGGCRGPPCPASPPTSSPVAPCGTGA